MKSRLLPLHADNGGRARDTHLPDGQIDVTPAQVDQPTAASTGISD